jgi:hypothetical protein
MFEKKDDVLLKICYIVNTEEELALYDCNNQKLEYSKIFPRGIYDKYQKKREQKENNMPNKDLACVWVLVGKKNQTETCIQVGSNKNMDRMLRYDIKEDIKDFFFGKSRGGKYNKLKNDYDKLTFYEVNIPLYLKKDNVATEIFGNEPENEILNAAYWCIKAAYAEGKIGYKSKAKIYNTSQLDGYYYNYFKNNDKQIPV